MKFLMNICDTEENVDLKTLCSYRLGGVGRIVCYPKNVKELKTLVKYLNKNKLEFFILGNGTNVVFEDCGVKEVIICLKKLKNYKIKKNEFYAEAGLNMFLLNVLCRENGLCGMEWSYGIPGTVGGAVCMNAGAYGREIGEFVEKIQIVRNNK